MASSAYDYALTLLTARPYSERNLRRKLAQKQFAAGEADSAVERLMAIGLIDDKRYAEQFTRGRLLGGGASKLRLKQQLYTRGIDSKLAASAIDGVVDDEEIDFGVIAEKAARKKLATLAGLSEEVVKRRLYGHLARAGYSPDMIRSAMAKAMNQK